MTQQEKRISLTSIISSVLLLISSYGLSQGNAIERELLSQQIQISSEHIDYILSMKLELTENREEILAKEFVIETYEKEHEATLRTYKIITTASGLLIISLLFLNVSLIVIVMSGSNGRRNKILYYALLMLGISIGVFSVFLLGMSLFR